jgi:hypothetical protein
VTDDRAQQLNRAGADAVPPLATTIPEPPGFVNRFELTIRADLEVIKAQPSRDEESQ